MEYILCGHFLFIYLLFTFTSPVASQDQSTPLKKNYLIFLLFDCFRIFIFYVMQHVFALFLNGLIVYIWEWCALSVFYLFLLKDWYYIFM